MRNPILTQPRDLGKERLLKVFGANVRRERNARAISQNELALRAGLNERTIAKIEAGELAIRAETRDRIQHAIGCSLANLTFGTAGWPDDEKGPEGIRPSRNQ
jgi:transcriptional regulator with XRE-family HTH domain